MICEFCGQEHNGEYGSGRFCSKSCRMKYIASKVKNHKCNWPHHDANNNWKCRICNKIFRTRKEMTEHRNNIHGKVKQWNKGLKNETSESLKKASETYKKHIKEGLIIPYQLGKPIPEEVKKKISYSMKKAHEEKRAYYIGKKEKLNGGMSYPEMWFENVIIDRFENKNFEYNFHVGSYYLDFAWVECKKCIEIDGEQHYRFERHIKHDKIRDEYLKSLGWIILRLPWKDIISDKEKYINIAKNFIDE